MPDILIVPTSLSLPDLALEPAMQLGSLYPALPRRSLGFDLFGGDETADTVETVSPVEPHTPAPGGTRSPRGLAELSGCETRSRL
jgi:hypothetical protein